MQLPRYERQSRLTLAYRERVPAEVDGAIVPGRRSVDDLRAEYPTIDVVSVTAC